MSYVEKKFIGLKGGIMDQFTINYGLKDNLILLNCSNSIFDYINFKSESVGIVLLNTNVKHSLINSAPTKPLAPSIEIFIVSDTLGLLKNL